MTLPPIYDEAREENNRHYAAGIDKGRLWEAGYILRLFDEMLTQEEKNSIIPAIAVIEDRIYELERRENIR